MWSDFILGIKRNSKWKEKMSDLMCYSLSFSNILNGFYVWFLLSKTIYSNSFVWFINVLCRWLTTNNKFWYNEVALLLNNSSTFKSKTTKLFMMKLPYTVYYFTEYSTELSTVEMCLNILKKKISEQWKKETV